jgi:hypothetical protein
MSSTKDSSLLKYESLTSLLPFLANFMGVEAKNVKKYHIFTNLRDYVRKQFAAKVLCGRRKTRIFT